MTKIIVAQDAPVLVAIDIAKTRHEVLMAIPDKQRRPRLPCIGIEGNRSVRQTFSAACSVFPLSCFSSAA